MRYTYKAKNTCSRLISFDIDANGVITNIEFTGGCSGNLKAIPKLVDGWTAQQIADKLLGNTCGARQTSCADQLAVAVLEASRKLNGT
ncbi:MAG TPA: TIGR03905 family TSCPD domain-containing protein [Clostridiales bacterium]|nr:TIGR03905 family TSCPD domain-containing protein [Clostridiales bacterium]